MTETRTRPAPSRPLEIEVYVKLLRAHERVLGALAPVFKRHDLTEPRYNVLRILRGAGDDALTCSEISGRMITRVPDITRLVDGLAAKGLVERRRCAVDRRVVWVSLTRAGSRVLAVMDEPVARAISGLFAHLAPDQLAEFDRALGLFLPD